MGNYEPIMPCAYGALDPKVNMEPDFFTGFQPERRKEIVAEEAKFYHNITQPYSMDEKLEKFYTSFRRPDGYDVPIKVYRPKDAAGPLPGVMFFHGGGFMTCSVETHDYVPSYLAAKAGVVCISVEYRLAPEHKFPVGIEDCYAACKYAAEQAEALGIVPSRMAVCGDSSGGNFAAVLTMLARERQEFKIWKQVLIYPATELAGTVERQSAKAYPAVGGDTEGPAPMLVAYLDKLEQAKAPLVSPMLAERFDGLPPALFIEAECDALVDDGLIYAKLLQDAGVPVECEIYTGMPHAFILRTYEETFAALDRICAFLRA